MTLVRIVKDYNGVNMLRQTPNHLGVWDGIQFTTQAVQECDYLVVLNRNHEDVVVKCPPDQIWALLQEPPVAGFERYIRGLRYAERIFTQDTRLNGPRFVHSHGALPWHLGKSYDELVNVPVPEKSRRLSWITSNRSTWEGHHHRINFLNQIQRDVEFDLWGRGFRPLDDKWEGLAPYRYSLAIENFSGPYYWTEKVIDCYLSWTMPLYFGCTNLADYFPAESFVQIDIHDPDISQKINEVIHSNRWQESRDAIAHARDLALNRHQLFPFVAERIHRDQEERAGKVSKKPQLLKLKAIQHYQTKSLLDKLQGKMRRMVAKFA